MLSVRIQKKKGKRELSEVMVMVVALFMVMVSCAYTYLQNHWGIYIDYVQHFFVSQSYIKKRKIKIHDIIVG